MYNRTLLPRNWLHDQRLPYTSGRLKSGASIPTSGRCKVTLTVPPLSPLTHPVSRASDDSLVLDSEFLRMVPDVSGIGPMLCFEMERGQVAQTV